MEISAQDVKKLREETGAGMMDCKKALVECGGDFKKAIDYLRIKGADIANKKSTRAASQGLVFLRVSPDTKHAAMIELNCETDFVCKNPEFPEMGETFLAYVMENGQKHATVDDLKAAKLPSGQTVKELLVAKIAKIGENMDLKRFVRLEAAPGAFLQSYVHMGSKIGVLLEMAAGKPEALASPEVAELAKDLTMQIAAARPRFLDQAAVDPKVIANEREVLKAKNLEAGKPADKIEKIVEGQIRKFYEDNCLVDQLFVKDTAKKVRDVISECGKKVGAEVKVTRFVRYQVGESEL